MLISETWLQITTNKFKIKGYNTIRCDRIGNKGGGAAIFIRDGIKYVQFPLDLSAMNNTEACAVQVEWQGKPLILISIYIPPKVKISKSNLLKFFSQFNSDFILGGVLNAHHPSWGNNSTCEKGAAVYEATLHSNYIILNNGEQTYRPHWKNVTSAIDITVISSSLITHCEWHTETDNWGSDHRPIEIHLQGNITYNTKFKCSLRHHTVKTNWNLVTREKIFHI